MIFNEVELLTQSDHNYRLVGTYHKVTIQYSNYSVVSFQTTVVQQ